MKSRFSKLFCGKKENTPPEITRRVTYVPKYERPWFYVTEEDIDPISQESGSDIELSEVSDAEPVGSYVRQLSRPNRMQSDPIPIPHGDEKESHPRVYDLNSDSDDSDDESVIDLHFELEYSGDEKECCEQFQDCDTQATMVPPEVYNADAIAMVNGDRADICWPMAPGIPRVYQARRPAGNPNDIIPWPITYQAQANQGSSDEDMPETVNQTQADQDTGRAPLRIMIP